MKVDRSDLNVLDVIEQSSRDRASAFFSHCFDLQLWYDPSGSICIMIRRDQGQRMTGNQIQAARALIGWSQSQTAEAAGVSVPTVKRAEGSGKVAASESAVRAIRSALEEAGVEFIAENGGGPGVRLRKGA